MKTFLMILQVITSIVLIVSVVLQSGKSAGLSGSISGAAEQAAGLKGRGLDGLLSKITTVAATLFIGIAIALLTIQK